MTNLHLEHHKDAIEEAIGELCLGSDRRDKITVAVVCGRPLTTVVLDDTTLTFSGSSGIRQFEILSTDLVGTLTDTTAFVKATCLTEIGRDAVQSLQDLHRR